MISTEHLYGPVGVFPPSPPEYRGSNVTTDTWDLQFGPVYDYPGAPSSAVDPCVYPVQGTWERSRPFLNVGTNRLLFTAEALQNRGVLLIKDQSPNDGRRFVFEVKFTVNGTLERFRADGTAGITSTGVGLVVTYYFDADSTGAFGDPVVPLPGTEAVAGPISIPSQASSEFYTGVFDNTLAARVDAASSGSSFAYVDGVIESSAPTTASDGVTRTDTVESESSVVVTGEFIDYIPDEPPPCGGSGGSAPIAPNLGTIGGNPQQAQIDAFGCSGCGG